MKLGALVLAALAVAGLGCTRPSNAPIGGLHSAGAKVYLSTSEGERPLTVGSRLGPRDHVRATGPAVIEYFGGGVHFLEGESLDVGDAPEAKVRGVNLPIRRVDGDTLVPVANTTRLVATRYADVSFTPESTHGGERTTGEYMKAFFTPDGIANLQPVAHPEGPRRTLAAPPFRAKVPRLHAGDLGEGGLVLEVKKGWVAAEGEDLATAMLRAGRRFDLGGTVRLLLFPGARATLVRPDGRSVSLKGPMDARLR